MKTGNFYDDLNEKLEMTLDSKQKCIGLCGSVKQCIKTVSHLGSIVKLRKL